MADQTSENAGADEQGGGAHAGSEDDTVQISQTELEVIRGAADGAKLSAKDLREINRRRRADQENAEQAEDDSTRTFDRNNLQSLLETDRSADQVGSPPDPAGVDSADAQGPTTAVASGDAVDEALAQGDWDVDADSSTDPTGADADDRHGPTTAVASGDAVDAALAKGDWDFDAPEDEPAEAEAASRTKVADASLLDRAMEQAGAHDRAPEAPSYDPDARPGEPSLTFEDLDIEDDIDVDAALNADDGVAAQDNNAHGDDDIAIEDDLDFDVEDGSDVEVDDPAGSTFDDLEEMLEEVDEPDGGLEELSDADMRAIVFGDSDAENAAGDTVDEDTIGDDAISPPPGSKPPPMRPPATPNTPSPAPAPPAEAVEAPSPQAPVAPEQTEIGEQLSSPETLSPEVSASLDDVELSGYRSTESLLLMGGTTLIGLGLVVISALSLIGVSFAAMDALAASLLLAVGILILGGILTLVLQQR